MTPPPLRGTAPTSLGDDVETLGPGMEAAALSASCSRKRRTVLRLVHVRSAGPHRLRPPGRAQPPRASWFSPVSSVRRFAPVHAGPTGLGPPVRGFGRRPGAPRGRGRIVGLEVVTCDAREQRFDRGGVGYVAALLHGLGELGMAGDPQADGAAGHAEAGGQIGVGGAARAEVAGAVGVFGFVEGWASGTASWPMLLKWVYAVLKCHFGPCQAALLARAPRGRIFGHHSARKCP